MPVCFEYRGVMMKQKTPQSSVIVRYTALLIAVIAALAGAVSLVLLRFAAERFERYELSTIENSLQIAADDLENQYEIISDIATKIQVIEKATHFSHSSLNIVTGPYRPPEIQSSAYFSSSLKYGDSSSVFHCSK